ncbi:hypothetical protein ACJJTC_001146, partial [Scirpophaga incertulas]
MPLLKRKAFEKSTASEYLRDDDEVFHCEITDEIFKDYEEYCERIILVNSMVWTCEMTGKNNLTYAEALESEKAARKQLKDFPMELRIPILFLAVKTNRTSFADMSEDIFNYVRERYFVGEIVEACLEGDIWNEAHVLSVIAQKQHPGSKALIPASAYCYEVEQFDENDPSAVCQIGTAPHDRVRRRKGVYTRDKNRLFLKQFVQQQGGIIGIKQTALDKYNISKVSFEQIFTGSPPEFPSKPKKTAKTSPPNAKNHTKPNSATKLNKSLKKPSPDKKGRQESMDKFVKKADKTDGPKPKPSMDPAVKKSAQDLAEKMRRAEDQMRQRKEEEKAKKKEKNARLQAYLKEWQKVKEDLDLEDHKVIPKGTLIDIEGIPHSLFGDFLSVLEFVYVYSDILKTKDVFHNGLDLETFRKSLTQKEHAGMFCDLVQMFLTTIFSLQEDEAEEHNESGGIQESTEVPELDSDMDTSQAVELATKASKWSHTYLGTPISKLPLDPTTVSEVLRLHLLASGSSAGARCATWRLQQRGGYSSRDDPGLRLRLRHPGLLPRLLRRHVHDLPLEEKFLVLQCLMNQILSYATVRDIIEEKLDEFRNTKQALRMLTINERKREMQLVAARQEIKKEAAAKKDELKITGDKAKAHDDETKKAIEKLAKDSEVKKQEYDKKYKELQTELFDYVSYLGSDRAFRRYWVNRHVGGVFVEAAAEPRGPCRAKPVAAPPAQRPHTLAYVATLLERETASSDKENDSGANSRGNSPKKPLSSANGLTHKLNGAEPPEPRLQLMRDLMVCTGDPETCLAHGNTERPSWTVYHTAEQIDALIDSLNKRGLREGELRHSLEQERLNIAGHAARCPLHLLTSTAPAPPVPGTSTRGRRVQPSLIVPDDCSLADALELQLRDHLLELEEKIFHGCLGALKVKDREAWRGTIMVRGYDKQAACLAWGPARRYRDDTHLPNGRVRANGTNKIDVPIPENKYRDPGYYLEGNGESDQETSVDVVRTLASALLQVEQAIHHKYLRRPLGLDDKERKEREAKNKPLDLDALERWEVSLMECRSVSQVVLHLFTLDSSVMWSASILNASCRICRRKADPDCMLLCDGCNKGHHLYCLKPKLQKVPAGDWFCEQCKPKERTPRKKRKLFSDEDIADELENSESESITLDGAVCGACGSGGRLAVRCVCAARYHAECAPARRGVLSGCGLCGARDWPRRKCATAAITNIQRYARALHAPADGDDDSDDSDDNKALVKLKVKRNSRRQSGNTRGR